LFETQDLDADRRRRTTLEECVENSDEFEAAGGHARKDFDGAFDQQRSEIRSQSTVTACNSAQFEDRRRGSV
jgi:hypothetical protein